MHNIIVLCIVCRICFILLALLLMHCVQPIVDIDLWFFSKMCLKDPSHELDVGELGYQYLFLRI
jgi:hypothetical protein